MQLNLYVVGDIQENCYFAWDEETRKTLIIDPGDDPDVLIDAVETGGLKPEAILLTHGHFDHIMAVGALKEKYKIPVIIGERDAELVRDPVKSMAGLGSFPVQSVEPDRLVKDGEILDLVFPVEVIETPGHTEGSVCYYIRKEGVLFAGDTLFKASVGRTWKPGDHNILIRSIRDKLLPLPDETLVLPGHGYHTAIGQEKQINPFLKE